ncbi:MAG: type IV secretory system conjugative DNA transfer family protein [Acidobacteriaceae bacterium]
MFDPGIIILWLILFATLVMVGALFYFIIANLLLKKSWAPRIMDSVFLEVTVPREAAESEQESKKEEKDMISVAEQFFSTVIHDTDKNLTHFLGIHDYISLEIVAVGKKISFIINVPKDLQSIVEKQLHAQYPRAHIDPIKPHKLFKKGTKYAAAELDLQKRYAYPIRTYKSMESDPLNSISNNLSKLSEDESAAIQLIISPAGESWQHKPRKFALEIQQGRNPNVVAASHTQKAMTKGFGFGKMMVDEFFSSKKKHPTDNSNRFDPTGMQKAIQLTPMQQEMVKKFEEKASRPGYRFNLRVVASSPTQAEADVHLKGILAAFMQYTLQPFNGFKVRRRRANKIVMDYIFRVFHSTASILNTEELASIWHPPTRFTETPNIKWLHAKKAPPPPNLPDDGLILGKSVYRGTEMNVCMKEDDRRRHVYIIGRTGTGKSWLMENMAIQDIKSGKGLCIVDPHGDLVESVLRYVPKERAEDVILFEPADMERPLGLNMLQVNDPSEKDFAIQEMIAIFYKLFPPEMIGPMFEHNMRNVMLTLMEDKEYPGTIADIPRMFTDVDFQKYKLSKVRDPIVRSFWEKEMAKTSDFHKSEMLGYLISKVGRFVENEMIRNIIGQPVSSFDFRKVMDEGKILLINLSKGRTGEVNARLLGLIIVSKLQMAALSRADIPEDQRRDFYLYVDEFQNFVTDSFATILSEARKYRLNLIMAHQFISQLGIEKEGSSSVDSRMRDAVFGNTGTMICFRIGVEDAEIMAKEFAPVFSQFDVINIDRFNAYIKLMIDGTASRPFNMVTFPRPEGASQEMAELIRNLSRLKFGRAKADVEEEILERTKLGMPSTLGPASTEKTR